MINSVMITGYLSILFFLAFNAFSFVYAGELSSLHPKTLILFFASFLGTLFFHGVNRFQLRALYLEVKENKGAIVGLNLASGFGWLSALYALDYLDAATMLCINMGTVSVVTFFLKVTPKAYKNHLPTLVALCCVLGGMGLIIGQRFALPSTGATPLRLGIGILLSVMDGVGGALNGLFSERLSKRGLSTIHILSLRFLWLALLTGLISLAKGDFRSIELTDAQEFLFVACSMLIIPLFAYQKAVSELGALIVSMLLPLMPIFAYFLEVSREHYPLNIWVLSGLLLCTILIGIMNVLMKKTKENP